MDDISRFVQRRPTRIPKYDYSSQNHYFVTICTHEKKCIFGSIQELNAFGTIAKQDMIELGGHFSGVRIENFVVMPNHVHAIIVIDGGNEKNTLSNIVGAYKSGVSRKIRKIDPDMVVWQRSFHDHIIRTRDDYEKIWNYVQFNPQKWESDRFYPKALRP